MEEYFKSKIGQVISHCVVTGQRFFTEVYARVYMFEVLAVKAGKATFEVTSYDTTPSGYKDGDSDKYFGEYTISLNDKGKAEIFKDIMKKADTEFDRRYGIDACFDGKKATK